jgi:hypothetical protein
MDDGKLKNILRIRIIRCICRHSLFQIVSLCQIILDYLSYEEAVEIYTWVKCKRPIRPCVDISLIDDKGYLKSEATLWLRKNNILFWYVPVTGLEVSNKILFSLLYIKPANVEIMWECPNCNIYKQIQYKFEDNIFKIKVLVLKAPTWAVRYLCKCGIDKIVEEKIEKSYYLLSAHMTCLETSITENNYLTWQHKQSGTREPLIKSIRIIKTLD